MEEANISEKINLETQSLNEEIKRLMSSYQNEKQECDELQKNYNEQLDEIQRIKNAIELFEKNHQQVEAKIKQTEDEIATLRARLDK
ncbi:hypothetical protein EIN_129380 [Entamoeba invadens IP1]|uniref:Uncharacterized protein n=1 Tax=Entamoeba invadens IP1 TaxID=370355 RepID=L7FMI0_ENTIV|nr:hypothetical protein EIN_129380 [Entamoeba invadens IP1]ELP91598.1 hypothetical protein EIN_129380 [Entamoeba invadens IP1]|eukprot:XP_004258369.1 hypothetical protein EIN_129380 [Entamoeba invadens IP1]